MFAELLGRNRLVFIMYGVSLLFHLQTPAYSTFKDREENPSIILRNSRYNKKWKKYGAYYDTYDVSLSSTFTMRGATSRVKVYRVMKILSTEGAKRGAIRVYEYAPVLSHFEPRLYNEDGMEIPLDKRKMRKTYLQSNKVVFPNVTKGSVLVLEMEFYYQNTYYSGFHEWFNPEIPIRSGTFHHKKSSNCVYDYRIYGSKHKLIETREGNTWNINDYEPEKDLYFTDYDAFVEPKIICKLLKVKSWSRNFHSNKKILSEYKNNLFGITVNYKGEGFNKILRQCAKGIKSPQKRATAILTWIQDNMNSSGSYTNAYKDVINVQNASDMQISGLCSKLMQKAGLKSHVVITGSKNEYVIDTTFLIHNNYITIPLPVVEIDGTPLVAYPFDRGYELGEYPLSFNKVPCLNLVEKEIQQLPPPKYGTKWIREQKKLNLNAPNKTFSLIYEYKENSASYHREDLLSCDDSQLEKKFQNWLKDKFQSNKLKTFTIQNLHDYSLPLNINIEYDCEEPPIPYGKKQIYKFGKLFDDYFSSITADRKEDVFIHNKAFYIDEVELMKIPGKKISLDMHMVNLDNALFTSTTAKLITDSSVIYRRELQYKPGVFTNSEFKPLCKDIHTLNSINQASIIIE